MANQQELEDGRRRFLLLTGSMAVASLAGCAHAQASSQEDGSARSSRMELAGRRKLGSLEVSSVGLGVQNMSRTYQTTVPSRPEMINIIRTALDRGVTFYDAAEAYGRYHTDGAHARERGRNRHSVNGI